MFWFLFAFSTVAGALSFVSGFLAALLCTAGYCVRCAAMKRPARPVRIALLLLSPVFGLFAGAVLFLLGPGF